MDYQAPLLYPEISRHRETKTLWLQQCFPQSIFPLGCQRPPQPNSAISVPLGGHRRLTMNSTLSCIGTTSQVAREEPELTLQTQPIVPILICFTSSRIPTRSQRPRAVS